jgi:sporulation integral membrane protein YtvI
VQKQEGTIPLADLDSIQRDKATILAIIKYLLIAGIAVVVIYFGFWLFGILLPFVFGFVMAQVANGIATFTLGLVYRIGRRRKAGRPAATLHAASNPPAADQTSTGSPASPAAKPAPASAPVTGRRKRGSYPHGLARSRTETRLAVVIYFVEVIGLIGLAFTIVSGGISQMRALVGYLPDLFKNADLPHTIVNYLRDLSDKLGGLLPPDFLEQLSAELAALQTRLIQAVPDIATTILKYLASVAGYLPVLLFIIIVVIISGYYFTAQNRFLYTLARRNITSKSFREKSIRLVNTLSTTLFRVIGGYIFLLVITFVMALIGLMIIKMPFPVIFAVILALLDLLPVLGIGTTLIPISIYMFVIGNVFGGVGALLLLAIMVLIRRLIEPPILGNALKLHPMATLVAMIVGYGIYGLGGIILGPIVFVVAREVMVRFGFDRKLRDVVGKVLDKISH